MKSVFEGIHVLGIIKYFIGDDNAKNKKTEHAFERLLLCVNLLLDYFFAN